MEVDSDKSQTMFLRLLISSKKLQETEVSRKELMEHLEKLRDIKVNKGFEKHLDELDKKLADLLEKERSLLISQKREHNIHENLHKRIRALEEKLTGYLEFKKKRMSRIKELEEKIQKRMQEKDKIAKLQGQIEGLDIVFESLQKSGSYPPEKLARLQEKISSLKEQVQ